MKNIRYYITKVPAFSSFILKTNWKSFHAGCVFEWDEKETLYKLTMCPLSNLPISSEDRNYPFASLSDIEDEETFEPFGLFSGTLKEHIKTESGLYKSIIKFLAFNGSMNMLVYASGENNYTVGSERIDDDEYLGTNIFTITFKRTKNQENIIIKKKKFSF